MASSVITNLIMFIAVLSITSTVVFTMNNFVTSSNDAIELQKKEVVNAIKTNIKIELIHYANSNLYVYIENTGSTTLKLEDINIYVNNIRIERNDENRTIEILEDTEIKNPGLWDPKEEIIIVVNGELEEGVDHKVVITSAHNGYDETIFST